MSKPVAVGTLAGHSCVENSYFLAEHWEIFRYLVFKDDFDMEWSSWHSFLVSFVVKISDDVAKLLEPLADVLRGDVWVFEDGDEDFISGGRLRYSAKTKNFTEKKVSLADGLVEKMEVRRRMYVRDLDRILKLVRDT